MRKKEGNKEVDILSAAIKVFAESGFFDAKIAKIAELANVSIGSIYVYYKNKDDILYKIFEQIWGGLYNNLDSLVSRKDLTMVEKYDAMIDMIFDTFTENSATAIVVAHEQQRIVMRTPEKFTPYYEKFVGLGEKIVKEGIKKGTFNQNINVNIFRHFLLGAFRDLINSWAVSPKEFPLNTMRQNIKFLSKYGLLNHK
ncbi:MAG: TetR/AcrR family transcriptional regulator [Ignavibacteriota bacterium]|nr:TetR/AcrR family transcriptional regulator [Ignavibacteriota bacterium]